MDTSLPTPSLSVQYLSVEKPFPMAIGTLSTPLDALPAIEFKIIYNYSGLFASTSYIFTIGVDVFRVYTYTISADWSVIGTTNI